MKCSGTQYKEEAGKIVAVKKVPVRVTMNDILEGVGHNANSCAIARAVSRATGCSESDVGVGGANITVNGWIRAEGVQKKLDRVLVDFVVKFDQLTDEAEDLANGFDASVGTDEVKVRKQLLKKGKFKKVKPFSFVLEVEQEVTDAPSLC